MKSRGLLAVVSVITAIVALIQIAFAQSIGLGLGINGLSAIGGNSWWKASAYQLDSTAPVVDADFSRQRYMIAGVSKQFTDIVTLTSTTKQVMGPTLTLPLVSVSANQPAYDYSTGRARWLIEPAASNIFLNSATGATQSVTTTGQNYTLSLYGTGSIALSGTATGTLNGTGANNRVQLTVTATAGTLTATVTGSTVDVQLETGNFASSYIPTAGSNVTRSADTATLTSPVAAFVQATAATMSARAQQPGAVSGGPFVGNTGGQSIIRASGTNQIAAEGSATLFANGTQALTTAFGVALGFDASGRSISFQQNTIASDSNQPVSRSAVLLGSKTGFPANIFMDEFVVWAFRGSNAGIVAQARAWQ